MPEFNETATAVEEFAVGAAETAAQVASHPVRSAQKQVRSFERRGAPAVRRINRRVRALMPERWMVFGVEVNRKLPETMAVKSLHLVKIQARRPDIVGDVAKGTLRFFNGSFKIIARTATRLEEASEIKAQHEAAHKPAASRPRRRPVRRHAA